MKHASFILVCLLALNVKAFPSTNTYAGVTNDWYNARFTNVFELAEQRIAANSNDIVAAYLMLEWQMAFGSVCAVSNAVAKTIDLADAVTNQPFRSIYMELRDDELEYRDRLLPTITESEFLADRHKSYIPGKLMVEDYFLRALWNSNLW